ncbi:MAG: TIR domain-containing protein [Parcubacteria group bacterium]|jgi:hypothetical protein
MTNPRVFISFDFDHNETEKHLFVGQAKNSKTPFSIEDWSSKASLPQSQWERLIEDKINRSDMVLVLVGKSMYSASGVEKEIAFATRNNVPVFGVYIDGASADCSLPTSLPRNRVISWDWNNIANAINQLMREGKNK